MASTASVFLPGNYRFVPAVFQYSGGVAAESGYRIERVRFSLTVPLDEGFRRIEQILREEGRPVTAFCACELRSPAPFDEAGFEAFNIRRHSCTVGYCRRNDKSSSTKQCVPRN